MALKGIEVIEIDESYPSPEEDDCFILESDPYKKSPSSKNVGNAEADLQVVEEKGQVACRDYPHSRHTCAKYPFVKTSHDLHCELCYCYVCDYLHRVQNGLDYLVTATHSTMKLGMQIGKCRERNQVNMM